MKPIIVTADDFACSPQITAGICEAGRCGVVTETSILVRSPWAAEAIAQGQDAGLSIGLHLDLVSSFVEDGLPLLGPRGRCCTELLGREFDHRIGQLFSCAELLQMRDEMKRQVETFALLAGCLPSHLNYHYGLHHLGEVMAMYITVAETYGLPVRWGEQYAGKCPYPLAPACLCDSFRGQPEDGLALFMEAVDRPCPGIKEILCHPGHLTPGLLADGYNGERELELGTLTDPRLPEKLADRGVQLVTFAWLQEHLAPAAAPGTTR